MDTYMNNLITTPAEGAAIPANKLLTVDEAAAYMGFSKGYLYKLMNRHAVPYYQPTGRRCWFKREELDAFMTSNRVPTDAELSERAGRHLTSMKGGAA